MTKKYTKTFPNFRKLVVDYKMATNDIITLFATKGYDIPTYGGTWNWLQKAQGNPMYPVGFGVPRWVEKASRDIIRSYSDGIRAGFEPQKELDFDQPVESTPTQMGEQLSEVQQAFQIADDRAKRDELDRIVVERRAELDPPEANPQSGDFTLTVQDGESFSLMAVMNAVLQAQPAGTRGKAKSISIRW
jgi:hypothetical protein